MFTLFNMGDDVKSSPAENDSQKVESAPAPESAGYSAEKIAKQTADREAIQKNEGESRAAELAAEKDPEKEIQGVTESETDTQTPPASPEVKPDANASLFSKERWSAVAIDVARGLAIGDASFFDTFKVWGLKIITMFTGKGWYNSLSDKDKELLQSKHVLKATADGLSFEWGETEAAPADAPEEEQAPISEEEKKALLANFEKAKQEAQPRTDLTLNPKKAVDNLIKMKLPYLENDKIKYVDDVRITSNIIRVGDIQYFIDKPLGGGHYKLRDKAGTDMAGYKILGTDDNGNIKVQTDDEETSFTGILDVLEQMRTGKNDTIAIKLANGKTMGLHLFKQGEAAAESDVESAAPAEKPAEKSQDAEVMTAFKTEMDAHAGHSVNFTAADGTAYLKMPFIKDGKTEFMDVSMTGSTCKVGDKTYKIQIEGGARLQKLEFKDGKVTMTGGVEVPVVGMQTRSGDFSHEDLAKLLENLRTSDKNVVLGLNGTKITFELQKGTV